MTVVTQILPLLRCETRSTDLEGIGGGWDLEKLVGAVAPGLHCSGETGPRILERRGYPGQHGAFCIRYHPAK